MDIYGGIAQTALQEAAKQQHLTSGDKGKKGKLESEDRPGYPLRPLLKDEAEVKESQQFAQGDEERIRKAQSALKKTSPDRLEKLVAINQRIENGFYDQQEVLESVAEKLLLMFRQGKQSERDA